MDHTILWYLVCVASYVQCTCVYVPLICQSRGSSMKPLSSCSGSNMAARSGLDDDELEWKETVVDDKD